MSAELLQNSCYFSLNCWRFSLEILPKLTIEKENDPFMFPKPGLKMGPSFTRGVKMQTILAASPQYLMSTEYLKPLPLEYSHIQVQFYPFCFPFKDSQIRVSVSRCHRPGLSICDHMWRHPVQSLSHHCCSV